jgi:hypothetical protein
MAEATSDSERERRASTKNWILRAFFGVGVLLALYILLMHGLAVNKAIAANLPLLLPLAVTVLSIFTRAADIRNYEAVLKISNDIAIGIISFDIWAISASRSDPSGRVLVNPATMIRGDFVLPFLLFGLLVAVGCVVLTHYHFPDTRAKHRWLLVGFAAAVIVYIAPFGVLESVPREARPLESRHYTVVIPYQDPDIVRYAPTALRERRLVWFERNVEATSPTDARAAGLKRFLESSASDRVKSRSGEKVVIRQEEVLVAGR